jgi:uncharacterized protein YqjF (DUF2071 family)
MLNYRVAPELLLPLVPAATQLDLWDGIAYVSVVGFLFTDTRLLGVPIPFHRTFEEVNLRFYVRRDVAGETRRGVTFIRELVPRAAIAVVARLVYNEPYRALRMRHHIDIPNVAYEWRQPSGWAGVHLTTEGAPSPLQPGSHEEFITQHYWGYTRQRDGATVEYEVRHPIWNVWHAHTARLEGDPASVYPPQFRTLLSRGPDSALLADGSAVAVHAPVRLRPRRAKASDLSGLNNNNSATEYAEETEGNG